MKGQPEELTKLIRYTTASVEKIHFNFVGKDLLKTTKTLSSNLMDKVLLIASMAEALSETRETETRSLAIERYKIISPYLTQNHQTSNHQQYPPPSEIAKCEEISVRLSELSNFASRIEEIMGEVTSNIEECLNGAIGEIQQTISDLFVETKMSIPDIKGKLSDSRSWGYSSYFNNVNYLFLGQKAAQPGMTIGALSHNPASVSALEESPEIIISSIKSVQTRINS
jgi:hypothetical protein